MSNLASLFNRYKALVIFDTETSGLNPGDDQIIELAALRTSSPSPASPTGCWRPRACRAERPSAASSSWSSQAPS